MTGQKKRILFIFLFVFCIAKVAWCDNQFSKGPESPFKVSISINEDSSNTDFYKKIGRFYVYTKVKNISNKDQEITVWTQYGWCWTSDNSEISPGKKALKNFPTRVILKPNQEYSQQMEMISSAHKTLPITFRLGFSSHTQLPIPERMDVAKSKGITWSNSVTLAQ
ncbi:MAG: hypothetical protein AAB213_00740 [Candidatus Omnitrophota bacterium]